MCIFIKIAIHLFQVLSLTLSILAIKVPVDGNEENLTRSTPSEAPVAENKQDSFYIPVQPTVDSYLIPPDPHITEEVLPDFLVTPATYFLPPSPDKQTDYYAPTEAGQQTDWYPIAQVPVESSSVNLLPQAPDVTPIILADNQTFNIPQSTRGGKGYSEDHFTVPVPSRQLEPPLVNAPNDYIVHEPSKESDVPSAEIDEQFYIPSPVKKHQIPIQKLIYRHPKMHVVNIQPLGEPSLALHLTPPKLIQPKFKKPTKIYPKKVAKGFHPIVIPISQFAEDSSSDVLRARPAKPFKPVSSDESEYFTPSDEKKLIQQKRKLKEENKAKVSIMYICLHYFVVVYVTEL